METSDFPRAAEAPAPVASPPVTGTSPYEQCDECGAPVETAQRYCVVCGTRRRHVSDPAARFMSAATSRSRIELRRQHANVGGGRTRRPPGLGTALVIALIPLGVGLGVLVGRDANSGDERLLAAIKAARQDVVTVGSGAPIATAAASAAGGARNVSTTFPLASGYAVELRTLPAGSRQSDAAAAETAARAKGATAVGVVSTSGYTITPKPTGGYVVYSGHYTSRAAAENALGKLKAAFPHAVVIAVRPVSSAPGHVLTRTRFGSATSATGYKPTQASLAQGASVASSVSKKIGHSYVNAQKGLPSVVSVP